MGHNVMNEPLRFNVVILMSPCDIWKYLDVEPYRKKNNGLHQLSDEALLPDKLFLKDTKIPKKNRVLQVTCM